jgi:hypothetical protein
MLIPSLRLALVAVDKEPIQIPKIKMDPSAHAYHRDFSKENQLSNTTLRPAQISGSLGDRVEPWLNALVSWLLKFRFEASRDLMSKLV